MAAKKEQKVPKNANVLLSIDDLDPDRNVVMIHGTAYEMMAFDDFGPKQQQQLQKITRRVARLFRDESTEQEVEIAQQALNEGIKLGFPDLNDEVLNKLSYMNRLQIYIQFSQSFTKALGINRESLPRTGMQLEAIMESIGDS